MGSILVVDSAPLVLKNVGINAKLDRKEYGAAVFGFNMFGDALRDVLAPRLPAPERQGDRWSWSRPRATVSAEARTGLGRTPLTGRGALSIVAVPCGDRPITRRRRTESC